MNKTIDLHVHSTASDGTFTPTELVAEAKRCGLSAFALTDHDTVDGISEALAAGEASGLEVIPGVELSTEYNETEIHVSDSLSILPIPNFRQNLQNSVITGTTAI